MDIARVEGGTNNKDCVTIREKIVKRSFVAQRIGHYLFGIV
jgi:hypothetical protein